MLCLVGTVQRVLDFQGTLFDFLAVTNVLSECCNLGSKICFLLAKNYLLFRGSTADFVLELGALGGQRFQLRFFFGAICQQFFHSFNLATGKIPGLSVYIVQVPEVSPKLGAYRVVGRAFWQNPQLVAVIEIQPVDFGSALLGLVGIS